MNRARRRRRVIAWGRYTNRYARHADVVLGGRPFADLLWSGLCGARWARPYKYVRRQGR